MNKVNHHGGAGGQVEHGQGGAHHVTEEVVQILLCTGLKSIF